MAGAALRERAARFCKANGVKSVRPLPHEALDWDDLECSLYFWTFGIFHPRRALLDYRNRQSASLRPASFMDVVLESGRPDSDVPEHKQTVKGRVSVITPTTEARRSFHEHLWESFETQKWPDKELIIVETFHTQPSGFWAELAREDRRVTYLCFKRRLPNGKQAERRPLLGGRSEMVDFSIGLKRNIGVYVASGEYVAHFDDDDLYAPSYLGTMVKKLKSSKAEAVKLAMWYSLQVAEGALVQCDPLSQGVLPGYRRRQGDTHGQERLYGFGFSLVYRRSVALAMPFKDMNEGEDFDFVNRILDEKGKPAVALLKDTTGICLNIQHGGNLLEFLPTRDVSDWGEVGKWEIASTVGFQQYNEIIHVAAGMTEFLQLRFPDMVPALQSEIEAALLHDWSQSCCAGTATGREPKRGLAALAKELSMTEDGLRDEAGDFVRRKFDPANRAAEERATEDREEGDGEA